MKPEDLKQLAEYIHGNYEIVTESGCWLWTGALGGKGYGIKQVSNKPMRAHRLSHLVFKGDIPDGLMVRHSCDVRCCINPGHLLLGTAADNSNDMVLRGRSKAKAGDKRVKLTKEQVIAVFNATGEYRDIGDEFGIDSGNVSLIKNRKTWSEITKSLPDSPKGTRVRNH